MVNRIFCCLPIALVAVLCGCATPLSTYPVLEETLMSDVSLDCGELDDEILKANAIRDAIFEEHGDVIQDTVLGSAALIAQDPISGILMSILASRTTSKAAKTYIEAAAAAGMRMEQLLVYKERDHCPDGPNADPERTDIQVLNDLTALETQLENEEVSSKAYISRRRELIDGLR
jgi:hypothetical protein